MSATDEDRQRAVRWLDRVWRGEYNDADRDSLAAEFAACREQAEALCAGAITLGVERTRERDALASQVSALRDAIARDCSRNSHDQPTWDVLRAILSDTAQAAREHDARIAMAQREACEKECNPNDHPIGCGCQWRVARAPLAATARTDATPLFLASDPVPVSELRRRYPDGWTTDATGDAKAPADDSGA